MLVHRYPRPFTFSPSDVLKSINFGFQDLIKDFKEEGFEPLDEMTGVYEGSARGWLSCGIPAVDWVFGRGLPFGRVIELSGGESSGKTSLAILFAAAAQRAGGVAGMLDFEQAAMPDRFRQLGLNTGTFMYYESSPENPLTIESGYKKLITLMDMCHSRDPSTPIVIIWDSVAASPSIADLESEVGELGGGMAEAARLHSQGLRKVTQRISSTNTILILINQVRDKVGPMAKGTTTPGGRAIKFYSSIRAELKKVYGVEHRNPITKLIVGQCVTLKTVKNKVSPPFREINMDVFLDDRGYDRASSTLSLLKTFDLISSAGQHGSKLVLPSGNLVFKQGDFAEVYFSHEREIQEFVLNHCK